MRHAYAILFIFIISLPPLLPFFAAAFTPPLTPI
jgi:hypothetical protein